MVIVPQVSQPTHLPTVYPPFIASTLLPVERAPSPLVSSSVKIERVVGIYAGPARNNIQGDTGTMTLRIVAVTPSGSAQLHLTESDGLQGNCTLSGSIFSNSELRAIGACQDSFGWYDAEIQAWIVDWSTIRGILQWTPRRGTKSQQQEQFEVRR